MIDCSWMLLDSGACASCRPEWFAPECPESPILKSLSGKTLEVLGRRIVQFDCGNGHSMSVQVYVCRGIPFPLVSAVLLQDCWTVASKDYLALILTGILYRLFAREHWCT